MKRYTIVGVKPAEDYMAMLARVDCKDLDEAVIVGRNHIKNYNRRNKPYGQYWITDTPINDTSGNVNDVVIDDTTVKWEWRRLK